MTAPMQITPEAVSAISTSMIGITQLLKFSGMPAKHAPLTLALLSSVVIMLWAYDQFVFDVIVSTSLVTMAASGVYGFTNRAVPPKEEPPPPVVQPTPPLVNAEGAPQ